MRCRKAFVMTLGLSVFACSGSDEQAPAEAEKPPLAPAECNSDTHPDGSYGTNIGDVVADQCFAGFADSEHVCTELAEHQIDTSTSTMLAFGDWHREGKRCPDRRKELLWVWVTGGW